MNIRGSSTRFLSLSLLAAACVFGCGKKAKPPAPVASVTETKPAPPPPPPPVCVPGSEQAMVSMASADDDGARFCISDGGEGHHCFSVTLASGTYDKLDDAPTAQAPALDAGTARVETTPTEVKVCSGEGEDACKTLKPKVAKGASEPIVAAIDASGATAVLMLGDAGAGKGVAEVWDVAKGKKLTTIKYAKGDHKCGSPQVLADVVYINSSVCAGPSAEGTLYSLKGKKLGQVGGKDYGTYGATAVQVAGNEWAFLEESAGAIAIQDVKTGKVSKTIDLVSLWSTGESLGTDGAEGEAAPPRAAGNPGESALVRGGDGKLVVISGAPSPGNLGIVDVATGEVTVVRARRCE